MSNEIEKVAKAAVATALKTMKKSGLTIPGWSIKGALRAITSDGSSPPKCILELTDNGRNAGAKRISITVQGKKSKASVIIHADDGSGFKSDDDLARFVNFFDSDSHKDDQSASDYGIGGLKACLTMAGRTVIVSRGTDGKIRGITIDLDKLKADEGFYSPDMAPPEGVDYHALWKSHAIDSNSSGTITVLTELRLKTHKSRSNLVTALQKDGFLNKRYFEDLENGATIKVNNQLLSPYDPLRRNEKGTQVLLDQSVSLAGAYCDITLVELTEEEAMLDGVNNNGIYINLCGIVIALSKNWLGTVPGNDSWVTRLRCMITFRSKAECRKVIEFTPDKSRVEPMNDLLGDAVNSVIGPLRTAHQNNRKSAKLLKDQTAFNIKLRKEDKEFYLNQLRNSSTAPTVKLVGIVSRLTGFAPGAGFGSAKDPGRITKDGVLEYNKGYDVVSSRLQSSNDSERKIARALAAVDVLGAKLALTQDELTMTETAHYIANLSR